LIYDRYAFNACFYYFLEQIKQASKWIFFNQIITPNMENIHIVTWLGVNV
jgi:hypothetical protein